MSAPSDSIRHQSTDFQGTRHEMHATEGRPNTVACNSLDGNKRQDIT